MSYLRKLIRIKLHVALLVAGVVWTTSYATVSIVEEHPADIVNMLLVIVSGLCDALVALLVFVVMMMINDLKREVRQQNTDLRQLIANHGLRIHANELAIESLRARAGIKD
jgi:hypothetical protein